MNALEFDRLVQKYQSLVYTICRQLVADEGYAQDLTQETFLSAWRSMDRCPAGYEKQWLARIASNKAKDYLRSAWARRVNTPGDEGLHALTAGQLDELGRLEAAEHLAYCDKCTDRYTALLTADALADPPRDVRRTVMSTIWVRLMQSTCGRAAVAGVAAVLALTMWRTGALTFVTDHGSDLQALLPTVQVTLPEKQPPKLLPEKLGRPVTSRPGENIYTRVSSVLESLLNAAENIKS